MLRNHPSAMELHSLASQGSWTDFHTFFPQERSFAHTSCLQAVFSPTVAKFVPGDSRILFPDKEVIGNILSM